jgi:hypothetical protein
LDSSFIENIKPQKVRQSGDSVVNQMRPKIWNQAEKMALNCFANFTFFSNISCQPSKNSRMDEIFGNYDPYWNLAVKFNRFFELNLSVKTGFCFFLSHSWMKSFTVQILQLPIWTLNLAQRMVH